MAHGCPSLDLSGGLGMNIGTDTSSHRHPPSGLYYYIQSRKGTRVAKRRLTRGERPACPGHSCMRYVGGVLAETSPYIRRMEPQLLPGSVCLFLMKKPSSNTAGSPAEGVLQRSMAKLAGQYLVPMVQPRRKAMCESGKCGSRPSARTRGKPTTASQLAHWPASFFCSCERPGLDNLRVQSITRQTTTTSATSIRPHGGPFMTRNPAIPTEQSHI